MKPSPSASALLLRSLSRGLGLLAAALVQAQPAPEPAWQPLFDGHTLTGWKAAEHPGSFKVVEGAIVCDGPRAHLFYAGPVAGASFQDFEFEADVLTRPGANSGIYFHTTFQEAGWPAQGFEVQINNSQPPHDGYYETKKTGSLYGVRNQYKAIVEDGVWFRVRLRVQGRTVQVRLNDTLVVDYVEPREVVAPADRPGRRLGRGTFALQCHDPGSRVSYRNLRVRLLPAALAPPAYEPVVDPAYRQIVDLQSGNYPIVNAHVHLKGGLTLEQALSRSRETGIYYGIAVNCGLGFAVTNDAGIHQYLATMQGQPAFVAMQAEGREWTRLFSREAIARFDYVFTDSMTYTDDRGRRMRLWMPDEVFVDDKQAFMDTLVDRAVRILREEPIDIYVNPTFLPDILASEYDTLWTPARMQRVIDAAVRHGVAIEINARYRLPSPRFIKLAKQAGARFSFGTNNGGADIGDLDYCLEMVKACGLQWQDLFVPERGRSRSAISSGAPPGGRPVR